MLQLIWFYLLLTVSNSLIDVCEQPYQSHMQSYVFRDQSDSLRKEFKKVKKEKSIFERKCEWLQKKLVTTKEQNATIRKQYQELQLKQLCQEIEGNYRYTLTHMHILIIINIKENNS